MAEGDNDSCSDDETVGSDDVLYRRVRLDAVNTTEEDGRLRPSSAAFELAAGEDGVSVYLASRLLELGVEPQQLVEGFPGYGVAVATVAVVREAGAGALGILRDPVNDLPPRPYDEAHALIVGLGSLSGGKNLKVRRRIAKKARWL